MRHRHLWHVEQQTGHRFCGACGRHDPPDPLCADRPSALWTMLTSRGFDRMIRREAERLRGG